MGTDGFDIYPMIMCFNFSWTRTLGLNFHTLSGRALHLLICTRDFKILISDHVIHFNFQSHNTLVHIENEKLPKHVLF
jgi:hypothetical protein